MDKATATERHVPRHGVVPTHRSRDRHARRATDAQRPWIVLPRTWLVLASSACFVMAVATTYDWLMSPRVASDADWYNRPRVHPESAATAVSPEARDTTPVVPSPRVVRVFPVVPHVERDPRGRSWGSPIIPIGSFSPMGTEMRSYLDRVQVAEVAQVVPKIKPRPKPMHVRDDRPTRSNDVARGASIRDRTVVGSMSNRKVTGNGGRLILEPKTMRMLAELERRWGERLQIRWAYRDSRLNRKVGGAKKSMHLQRKAVDIVHGGWSRAKMVRFVRLAYSIGFRGFGLGRNVVHIDTRARFTSWNYGGNRYGSAFRMVR